MLDASFGVIPKQPRWHAFCTMEVYQFKARELHLSLLLPMSCMFLVPRAKTALTMASSTCCKLHGPAHLANAGTDGLTSHIMYHWTSHLTAAENGINNRSTTLHELHQLQRSPAKVAAPNFHPRG